MTRSRRSRGAPGNHARRSPNGGTPVATGSPSHTSVAAVAPPALRDGQVRCVVCRNATSLTPNGNLRQHSDLFGNVCTNRRPCDADGHLVELPPVVLDSGNTVPPTGCCQECGRWVPPMRRLCGRCMSSRV